MILCTTRACSLTRHTRENKRDPRGARRLGSGDTSHPCRLGSHHDALTSLSLRHVRETLLAVWRRRLPPAVDFFCLLNDYTLVWFMFPPGGAHSSHHRCMHSQETGQRTLKIEKVRVPARSSMPMSGGSRTTNHRRRATARPATSKLALQTENGSDNGRPSLRAWAGSARLGRQRLQQPRQAVRRERLRKCARSGARGKQEGKSAAGRPPHCPCHSWRAV